MILGANPREYSPSPPELMMGETGERIRIIYADNEPEEILKALNRNNVKLRQILFNKYSFIHYDVMGSGRFFYVEDIQEITLDLLEKK